MFQIRDWLWLSGYPEASSPKLMKAEGIQAMLQLFERFDSEGIVTHFIPVNDGVPITKGMIKEGIDFIHQQHEANRTLLVTCGKGISRSVTFSIIALKEIEGLSLEEAYRSIHIVHPKALPDHIHWQAISEYYDEKVDFWRIWGNLVLGSED